MPDPRTLKVGDLVRFVSLPEEWTRLGYKTPRDSIAFMKKLLKRSHPSRVAWIDEYGTPWIQAWIRQRGRIHHHSWGILESTGWRPVKRRRATRPKS